MNHADTKFGPPPPFQQQSFGPALPPVLCILLLQLAVCLLFLLVVQPPFVTSSVAGGRGEVLCPSKMFFAAGLTVASTVLLHTSGLQPQDTFKGGVEFLYSMSKH